MTGFQRKLLTKSPNAKEDESCLVKNFCLNGVNDKLRGSLLRRKIHLQSTEKIPEPLQPSATNTAHPPCAPSLLTIPSSLFPTLSPPNQPPHPPALCRQLVVSRISVWMGELGCRERINSLHART